MISKIAVLILMLLAIPSTAFALEPIYLGSGHSDQAINLDAGAKQPNQNYSYGRFGFVTPSMPQPMALSPHMMIKQTEDLLDEAQKARDEAMSARDEAVSARDEAVSARGEAVSARDQARAQYEEAQVLLAKIEKSEQIVGELQNKTEASTRAAAVSASQAENFLNKTEEACSQMKSMLLGARTYANDSALYASQAGSYFNLTQSTYNKTVVVYSRSASDYNNMTLLAKEIRSNYDSIRAMMNQTYL
ncbi:MAG: hypothetical protein A4E44_01451 [Methanosaeta sp. PtaB.Bin018]|jgi:hypothetical protein|nr:MAG: hypothetical protein A4E44_01451 [Methanosaeta sp. PtaB.Bin018]